MGRQWAKFRGWLSPLVYLSSNQASRVGVGLVTTAVVFWVYLLPTILRGESQHPYLGILTFLILPAGFFGGLALIPLGIVLRSRQERRRGSYPVDFPKLDSRNPQLRRLLIFIGITTFANVIIGGHLTYSAVNYMDSVTFCGLTCHSVMAPEYTAYRNSPHSRVECVKCHIGPGASWFVRSKLSGAGQVFAVVLHTYPKPIPTPVRDLRPARETCEACHWPEKFSGDKLIVKTKYGDDEKNTPAKTVVLVHIGGRGINRELIGIHGRHLGLVTYVAADGKRQTIPWVRYQGQDGSFTDFVSAETDSAPAKLAPGERRVMDCMDCHNRPTHLFRLPEEAVNEAIEGGRISPALPFIHKLSGELLKRGYASRSAAQAELPEAVREYYRLNFPAVYNAQRGRIEMAATALADIYSMNVFPDMNVTWGTYPNNLGHTDFPGCFRCHDGNHKAQDGRVITQDCSACHNLLAVEETEPKILRELSGGS